MKVYTFFNDKVTGHNFPEELKQRFEEAFAGAHIQPFALWRMWMSLGLGGYLEWTKDAKTATFFSRGTISTARTVQISLFSQPPDHPLHTKERTERRARFKAAIQNVEGWFDRKLLTGAYDAGVDVIRTKHVGERFQWTIVSIGMKPWSCSEGRLGSIFQRDKDCHAPDLPPWALGTRHTPLYTTDGVKVTQIDSLTAAQDALAAILPWGEPAPGSEADGWLRVAKMANESFRLHDSPSVQMQEDARAAKLHPSWLGSRCTLPPITLSEENTMQKTPVYRTQEKVPTVRPLVSRAGPRFEANVSQFHMCVANSVSTAQDPSTLVAVDRPPRVVQGSLDNAVQVATKLARDNPGVEYLVLKAIRRVRVSPPAPVVEPPIGYVKAI